MSDAVLTFALMVASGYLVPLRIPCIPMPWGCYNAPIYVQLYDLCFNAKECAEEGRVPVRLVEWMQIDEDNGKACLHSFSRVAGPEMRTWIYPIRTCYPLVPLEEGK